MRASDPSMSAPTTDLAQLRVDYRRAALSEHEASPDPHDQFARWLDEAVRAAVPEPNAMTLATVDADGRPSARVVLLKSFDARGFVFHTNYESRKGRDLAGNPAVSLLFFWPELERQVRIDGTAAPVGSGVVRKLVISSERFSRSNDAAGATVSSVNLTRTPPQLGGRGTPAAKRACTAATCASSQARSGIGVLCGDAQAPT